MKDSGSDGVFQRIGGGTGYGIEKKTWRKDSPFDGVAPPSTNLEPSPLGTDRGGGATHSNLD